ncbi:TPA: hypothetical protein CPT91_08635 [Candidatus Gastranaerophilales bacterium HUM_16]|nr:MAG TPA: hypothetical protein CPT91_08635 [Candidatus Gastranaerophilales bacterium HUM_16]
MAKSMKVDVNPDVLVWARKNSSLDIDIAASKIKVKIEQLRAWESGDDKPSIAQLRKLANIYKFPISVFFLSVVPKNFSVMKDFRHLPEYMPAKFSRQLQLEIRKVQQRRETAIELQSSLVDEISTFDKKVSLEDDVRNSALKIREILHLDINEQKKWSNPRIAFNEMRYLVENTGILVFEVDNVDIQEMRGFAIAEKIMPVIAINRKDSFNGRIFSLLHEFVHILLGQGGISNSSYYDDTEEKVEVFCNKLAAEILVPSSIILSNPYIKTGKQRYSDSEILAIAKNFSVSEEVILRRLLTLEKISNSFYKEKREEYLEIYKRNAARTTNDRKFKQNVPQQTITGLGIPFISFAIENFNADKITLNDLSNALGGIKIKHIRAIGQKLGGLYV